MRTVALFSAFLAGCLCSVSDKTVVRTVEAAGLTDVEPGSWAPLSCSDGDRFRSHFKAKNAAGNAVHGVVCCGFMKACTVRYE